MYFRPLPHQQGSFLPGFCAGIFSSPLLSMVPIRSNNPIVKPFPVTRWGMLCRVARGNRFSSLQQFKVRRGLCRESRFSSCKHNRINLPDGHSGEIQFLTEPVFMRCAYSGISRIPSASCGEGALLNSSSPSKRSASSRSAPQYSLDAW